MRLRILSRALGARPLVGAVVLTALVGVGACRSAPSGVLVGPEPRKESGVESATSPTSWVEESRQSPIFWWIWSDVRDHVGGEEWRSLDVAWMPARARADLARARTDLARTHATWGYKDFCLVGGLWRLDLEREAALELLAAHDGDAIWPLSTPGKRPRFLMDERPFLWRPRLERWYRAQPAGEAAQSLRTRLAETWHDAMASRDAGLAAAVVPSLDEQFGRESADALAPEARDLVRGTLSDIEERRRARPGYVFCDLLPLGLLERFGVPEHVDLEPFVEGTRLRAAELSGEPIPLPHPYGLDLLLRRLERLRGPSRP